MLNKIKKWYGILGPGFSCAEADNDAGAVATYIQAGALYGFGMFWLMALLLPITYFCQECVLRLGIVTQKGPITLIKEKFGNFWAKITLINLFIVNFLTLITEFAGINLISQAFHLNSFVTVPLSILILCFLVSPFNYHRWERIMVGLCIFDLSWIILTCLLPYHSFNIVPNFTYGFKTPTYLMDVMAIVGTTTTTWQLVYQHSCIIDKKMTIEQLKEEKTETLFGSFFTIIVAMCMIFVGSIAFFNHWHFSDVPHLALQIQKTLGTGFASLLFLLIVNASIIGTAGVTLSSAWAYAEYKEIERSLNKKFSEAKGFYIHYFGSIIFAGFVTMIPRLPLELVIIGVQVLSCVMLPFQLILTQLLLNDPKIMGHHVNSKSKNAIINTIIALIIILSIFLFKQAILK
jgi:Mn2+/Fe2+ NRAMP family transporter